MQVHPLPGLLEPVSALTHLLGALVFAGLAIPLLRRARGDPRRVALLGVYAFACVLLLSASGVYHMLPEESWGRAVMGRVDLAAIFVLIAGTHTPVQGLFFRGLARWGVLLALWTIAALGITLFTTFYDELPHGLGTGIYLLMGWIAGASGLILWRRIGTAGIAPLLMGGVAYSIGAVLQWQQWPNLAPGVFGAHELWHLAVLAGWACTGRSSSPTPAEPWTGSADAACFAPGVVAVVVAGPAALPARYPGGTASPVSGQAPLERMTRSVSRRAPDTVSRASPRDLRSSKPARPSPRCNARALQALVWVTGAPRERAARTRRPRRSAEKESGGAGRGEDPSADALLESRDVEVDQEPERPR